MKSKQLPTIYLFLHKSRRVRQSALILLLLLSILTTSPLMALAESNAPEPSPQSRPDAALQLYTAGVQLAPLLPDILGFSEPRTYLLLLQNNHELRATGGFITAIGRITLDNGRITELTFEDSYAIYRDDVDHPLAPAPLKRYMEIEILFLRDINWSPDFPTTARLAASLYAQDAGVQVDGVVSLDLRAVALLVGALAPLQVAESDLTLTPDNVMTTIMHFWNRPPTSTVEEETELLEERQDWLYKRKDFIPLIAESAMDRLQSGDFNPARLIEGIAAALNERAVQIWLTDPDATALLAQQGWDGGLHPQQGADYVALVDTNMGYNKVDAVIERQLTYTVDWSNGPTAPAQATVSVSYHHPLNVVDEVCSPRTTYTSLGSYEEMTERCYFSYVRLYVPKGSELISVKGVEADSITEQPGERGTQLFAGYFSLEPSEEHIVTFTYTLPPHITPDNYQLLLQRQSGAGPLPLQLVVADRALTTTLTDGSLFWPLEDQALAAR